MSNEQLPANKPKENPIRAIENAIKNAKSMKEVVKLDFVKDRIISNYKSITGRKDGDEYFENEAQEWINLAMNRADIFEADPMSVMAGILRGASYGLSVGSGKLSVYTQNVKAGKDAAGKDIWKKMLVVKPDAHGKKELLERMPSIKKIDAGVVVFKEDKFEYDPDAKIVTVHKQSFPRPKASKDTVIGAYCKVHFTDHVEYVVLDINELETARSKSKMDGGGQLWNEHYGEACKKTTYNRAYKELYVKPDSLTLYRQFEVKDADTEDYTEASVVDETAADAPVLPTETEKFDPSVNEETGEVYDKPEAAADKKKKKAKDEEAFI